jgi:hypothetical protein
MKNDHRQKTHQKKTIQNHSFGPIYFQTPGILKGQALGSHVSKAFLQAASTLAAAALREKAAVGMEEVATTWGNGMTYHLVMTFTVRHGKSTHF